MIPQISHSRSQLVSYLNEHDDGAKTLVVSTDTYPDLFSLQYPEIVGKSPTGWRQKTMKYLWFPADRLDESDIDDINQWRARFKQYVLLGLNKHITNFFTDELDFCMALDFNYDLVGDSRTHYGEAEYQLKYQGSEPHLQVLIDGIAKAVPDLPMPDDSKDSYCISCIPGSPVNASVQYRLAKGAAEALGVDFIDADLNCEKPGLKGVAVDQKIPIWQNLYDQGCVSLSDSVADRLVIVVDDLYQSGATLWMYAKFLKQQGATNVIGLPCVKSLRDSDNQ